MQQPNPAQPAPNSAYPQADWLNDLPEDLRALGRREEMGRSGGRRSSHIANWRSCSAQTRPAARLCCRPVKTMLRAGGQCTGRLGCPERPDDYALDLPEGYGCGPMTSSRNFAHWLMTWD